MVALYEEGGNIVCGAVRDLPESQGQTSETPQQDAFVTHSHVEMGGDHHGFLSQRWK